MERKKMGRPTEDPKTNGYRLRMTEKEIEILNFCCEKTGKSKADILRLGLQKIYQELKNNE